MPRKGTATVKKSEKYVYEDSTSEEEEGEPSPVRRNSKQAAVPSRTKQSSKNAGGDSDGENVEPGHAREQRKRSNEARHHKDGADQPRQDSVTEEQRAALAQSLFPNEEDGATVKNDDQPHQSLTPSRASANAHRRRQQDRPVLEARSPHKKNTAKPRAGATRQRNDDAALAKNAANLELSTKQRTASQIPLQGQEEEPKWPDNMIQGGAHIPPNQQRNMRACMVCSIVRTQQQFTTNGCPNCEDILELIGNPEQVNDCTSQVFEGLISVADTNRSWVARYQRLEGYVPGVYATQVEGILPEDVLVAVENAGINYVPRDGSEQEMLGKD